MSEKITVLKVRNQDISIFYKKEEDYISLTDIARIKNAEEPKDVVKNWFRNRSTVEFLGLWERINNPHFKGVEFDSLYQEAGNNSFTLSPSKWIDTTGAVGIINKIGRGGGTFAHIVPNLISKNQINFTYANEADLLNVALFGITAKQWKEENPNKKGNIRDEASIEQLVVLSNMESINALLIEQGLTQKDRLIQLNKVAIMQMKSFAENDSFKRLESN